MRGLPRSVCKESFARASYRIASFSLLDRCLSSLSSDLPGPGNDASLDLFSCNTAWSGSCPETALLKVFERAVHSKHAKQASIREFFEKQLAQISKDHGSMQLVKKHAKQASLREFFEKQLGQMSKDHGLMQLAKKPSQHSDLDIPVLLCNNLPVEHLEAGFITLINALIKRAVHSNADLADKKIMMGKALGLLKQMKGKGYSPPQDTSRQILTWISTMGDVIMFKKVMLWLKKHDQELFKEFENELILKTGKSGKVEDIDMKVDECKDVQMMDATGIDKARGVMELLDRIDVSQTSSQPALKKIFFCLGRSGDQTVIKDYLLRLPSKGSLGDEMVELIITSYVEGLSRRFKGSMQLKKDVEGFKMIITSLNLRPSASLNVLIARCGSHGEIDLCIDLIKSMKEGGMELSANTYEPLIIFYARTLEIAKAEYVLSAMKSRGMLGTEKSYQYLIQAHTISENVEKAFNVIEEICSRGMPRTPAMYTPIIYAYGSKGMYTKARHLLKSMEKNGVRPNADNFAALIQTCAVRKASEEAALAFRIFEEMSNEPIGDCGRVIAAMLRVCATCGDLSQAQQIMSSKKYAGLVGNVEAKSAILSGLARGGDTEEALNVFSDIRRMGAWPVSSAFLALLDAIGISGDLDQLLLLFNSFRKSIQGKNRVQQEEQSSAACVTVVLALIRYNKLGKAAKFLQHIQRDNIGDAETLCLQVFQNGARPSMLQENSVQLTLEDKFKFLEVMYEKLKFQPTRIAFESLLESCAKEKNLQRAQDVVRIMKRDHLHLNIFTYLILFRTVVLVGDEGEVTEIAKEMKEEMESYGLQDADVKKIIAKILKISEKSPVKCNSALNSCKWRKKIYSLLYPEHRSGGA